MNSEKQFISIWLVIGSLLTVYGVLILGAGISRLASSSNTGVVLSSLHIDIWWGVGILLFGLFFVIRFRPNQAGTSNTKEKSGNL